MIKRCGVGTGSTDRPVRKEENEKRGRSVMMRKETKLKPRSAPIYEDLSLQDKLKTVNQRFPRSIQSAFNRAVTKRLDDGIFRGRSVNDWV